MYKFLFFIFLVAIIERLREFSDNTGFQNWWENSVLSIIENEFWFKWFRSNGVDKHLRLYPLYFLKWISYLKKLEKLQQWNIPNHPAFYDGYHNFKAIMLFVISVYGGSKYGWKIILFSWLIWYIGQKLIYYLMQRSTWEK